MILNQYCLNDYVPRCKRFLFKIAYQDLLYLVHDFERKKHLEKNNTRLVID